MQIAKIPTKYSNLLFILLYYFAIGQAQDTSYSSPECYIEIYGRNYSCAIIPIKEAGKSSLFILEDSSDSTEDELKPSAYVNVSETLTDLPRVSEYRLTAYSKKRKNNSEWLVKLSSVIKEFATNTSGNYHLTHEKCFSSGIIYILNLPVAKGYIGNQIRPVVNYADRYEPCNKANFSSECGILYNSISFQPYTSRQLLVLTMNTDRRMTLRLRLMFGECKISCAEGSNSCQIDFQDYLCPEVYGRGSNVYAFHPVMKSPAYYCVTVKSVGNECCEFGTETILLEENPNVTNEIFNDYTSNIYFRAAMLIFIVLVAAILLVLLRGSNFSVLRNNNSQHSFGSSTEPFIMPFYPGIYKQQNTEVLLIYSRQSDDFVAKMGTFARELEQYVGKVWDPLGRDERQFIRSPVREMMKLMKNEELKIILIANEDGLEIECRFISGTHAELENPHRLDEIFLSFISRIFHDPNFLNDHEHLYLVSFEKTLQFSYIVTGTRYELPKQCISLILALLK